MERRQLTTASAEGLWVVGVLLVLLLCAFGGWWAPLGIAGESIEIYETRPAVGLNPFTGTGEEWERFISLIFESLFEYEDDFKYQPVLATLGSRPPRRSGARLWTVDIRSDAYFYRIRTDQYTGVSSLDSTHVTADDVVKSYQLYAHSKSQLTDTWHRHRLMESVESVGKVSDSQVTFTFKEGVLPLANFLSFSVVPADAIPDDFIAKFPPAQSKQSDFASWPVGSGRYAYAGIHETRGFHILKRNEQVTSRSPLIDEIEIHRVDPYQLGTIVKGGRDEALCVPSLPLFLLNSVDNNFFNTQRLFSPSIDEILFNVRTPPMNDLNVRRALSMAIDRKRLMATHLTNLADTVTGPFPARYSYYCDTCVTSNYSYRPRRAGELLTEAGWILSEGKQNRERNGTELEITLLTYTGSQGSMAAELVNGIAKSWRTLGVKVNVVALQQSKYLERIQRREYQAAYYRLRYFVVPNVKRHFSTTGVENYSGLVDPKIDSLLTVYRSANVPDYRLIYHKLHRTISDHVPAAFLWSPHQYALWSNWVEVRPFFQPHNFIALIHKWKIQ